MKHFSRLSICLGLLAMLGLVRPVRPGAEDTA